MLETAWCGEHKPRFVLATKTEEKTSFTMPSQIISPTVITPAIVAPVLTSPPITNPINVEPATTDDVATEIELTNIVDAPSPKPEIATFDDLFKPSSSTKKRR